MADPQIHEAFEKLRPVCVTLTKNHTRDNVALVLKALREVPCGAIPHLQEYALFPLRLILKQSSSKSPELYTDAVTCMDYVFQHSEVQTVGLFHDVFISLCLLLSSPSTETKVPHVPEELKLAVVKCIINLHKQLSGSVLTGVYTAQFLPTLGHAVSLLLHIAEHESMRELRIQSVAALVELSLANRKVTQPMLIETGNLFASFLPGISMTLCKVIKGDTKQGHLVTTVAIEAWAKIVTVVMNDECLVKCQKKDVKEAPVNGEAHARLLVTRDTDWVAKTASKLAVLVERIAPLVNHDHWKVRLAMVGWGEKLLMQCTQSLEKSIPHFLEVLVSRVTDDYPTVKSRSKCALDKFKVIAACSGGNKPLVEILEDNLHSLCTALPRLMRVQGDDKKRATLALLLGYLELLGPNIKRLLRSYSHLERLSLALVQVLEFDCSSVHIVQEKASGVPYSDLRQSPVYTRPRKHFKHFTDENIYHDLGSVCRMLGSYGDLELLVDHFLDLSHQTSLYRKQAIFLVNEVLLGVSDEARPPDVGKPDDLDTLVGQLVQEYLQPEGWNRPTCNQSDDDFGTKKTPDLQLVPAIQNEQTSNSLQSINSNIIQTCLLLEGIGNLATVSGSHFDSVLMEVLYPVLEKLGDDSAAVGQTAFLTLTDICTACRAESLAHLLRENADYLVDSISLRLRRLHQNPRSPLVLKVVLAYSDKAILPLVEDTVGEVLRSLDEHHAEAAMLFIRVLHTLVTSVRTWFPTEPPQRQETATPGTRAVDLEEPQSRVRTSIEEIQDYFREYHRQQKAAEAHEIDDGDESTAHEDREGVEMDDCADPPKAKLPHHISMVMQVMERCTHLASAPDARLRLLVLDTIGQCCLALCGNQDELLPLVHQVWQPFVRRFDDDEPLVTIKACEVLGVLGVVSRDFIRRRVLTDVIPKMTSRLNKMAAVSLKAGPGYSRATWCKMQRALLENAGKVAVETELSDRQLSGLLRSCLPYLSCRQPDVLQQAALEAFRQFAVVDSDGVWLLLNDVCSPGHVTVPHASLPDVPMAGSKVRTEYTDNVMEILTLV